MNVAYHKVTFFSQRWIADVFSQASDLKGAGARAQPAPPPPPSCARH